MMRRITLCITVAFLAILIGGSLSFAKESRQIKFAVFSDPHFYHKSLGTEGAFEAYILQDRKMLKESEDILDAAIDAIIEEGRVKFVLVPGDLTKDGERLNHFLFALKMKKLERAGIQVFVVPGNHDINNPHAFRYNEDGSVESIPNVSPGMFRWIYNDFGYRQAIHRDPHSLSYVVEPSPGLWLIAMDACDYDGDPNNGNATSGHFSAETLDWVLKIAKIGKAKGKTLIGMMHHGILEHYFGQSEMFPDYVVKDWDIVSNELALAGLQVIFTGHYHANDISKPELTGKKLLFDIETGSLVTYPCPYRIIDFNIANRSFKIETFHIDSIASHPTDFPAYARDFLQYGMTGIVGYQLSHPPYNLADPTLSYVTGLVVPAFMAHYAGDETPDAAAIAAYTSMMSSSDPVTKLLGESLYSLWTDIAPEDNNTTITVDP